MTQSTDFDRLVTSWLETAGPADLRPEALDAALATARSTPRRRRMVAFLAGPAQWPVYGRPGFATIRPALRIALVVALLTALITGGIYVGSQVLRRTTVTPIDAIQVYEGTITRLPVRLPPNGIGSVIALPDGRILGLTGDSVLTWDVTSGEMSPAGSLSVERGGPTVVLHDGRALFVGGDFAPPDASGEIYPGPATAEVWDPRTRTSSSPVLLSPTVRVDAAVRLLDGRVLVTGGTTTDLRNDAPTTAGLFDPTNRTFTPTGSLTAPRVRYSMALLPDGRVAVIGGSPVVSDAPDISTTEVYDPVAGTFSPADPLDDILPNPDDTRYPLSTRAQVVRLTSGEVLVPGLRCQEVHAFREDGLSDGVRPTPIERWDPATETFSVVGSMPHCVNTAVPLPNGELFVMGWWYTREFVGHDWAGIYNPQTGEVREVETPDVNNQPYVDVVGLSDGRVFFFGTGIEVME